MLSCHNVGLKYYRWWKPLFFHLVDIAIVNSFLFFQKHRQEHPNKEALQRSSTYSIVVFKEALIRQICT